MSSGFNSIEKNFSRFLSYFPGIKKIIKKTYIRINFYIYKKEHKVKSDYSIHTIDIDSCETFFGYYDKCPDNGKGDVIVCASTISTHNIPDPNNPIKLYVYNLCTKDKVFIANISAYNWQQGCRAHWLNDDLLIYNFYSHEKRNYSSKIYSIIEKKHIAEFSFAVQDSFLGNYFLSINYSRLMALRPDYGYRNKSFSWELFDLANDGIWKVDISSRKGELIVTFCDIINFEFENNDEYKHKVNHVMISPDGEKFIFIHRYYYKGKRNDRLMLSTKDGHLISVLANNKMVSHCCWLSNDKIIGYLRSDSGDDSYWVIDINNLESYQLLDGELLKYGDGHPSNCKNLLVTDTYPNKSRYQKLLLVDMDNDNYQELGEFLHDLSFSDETRCDLHPRFSHDGSMIFFDSVFSGKRKLCYLQLINK